MVIFLVKTICSLFSKTSCTGAYEIRRVLFTYHICVICHAEIFSLFHNNLPQQLYTQHLVTNTVTYVSTSLVVMDTFKIHLNLKYFILQNDDRRLQSMPFKPLDRCNQAKTTYKINCSVTMNIYESVSLYIHHLI